jgi:diaminopimelate epimerase
MAASTFAAGLTGRVPFGTWTTVLNPGGRVCAMSDGAMVTIQGNATFEWDGVIEVDLATGAASDLRITRRRDGEVAAWDALVAAI